jgi:GNAT superfamily N-acetyltransferase
MTTMTNTRGHGGTAADLIDVLNERVRALGRGAPALAGGGTTLIVDPEPWSNARLEDMLRVVDADFTPRLSERSGMRHDLAAPAFDGDGIRAYLDSLERERAVALIAMAGDVALAVAVMIREPGELYVALMATMPAARGLGLMTSIYEVIEDVADHMALPVRLRTSSENGAQIHILTKRGYERAFTQEHHRGPGVHTVHWRRSPMAVDDDTRGAGMIEWLRDHVKGVDDDRLAELVTWVGRQRDIDPTVGAAGDRWAVVIAEHNGQVGGGHRRA